MQNNIDNRIESFKKDVITKRALYTLKQKEYDNKVLEIENLKATFDVLKKTSEFLNSFSSSVRDRIAQEIETLVSRVLKSVFNDRYSFKVKSVIKRGNTEVELLIHDIIHKKDIDIIESSGGGLADIVATILFFAFSEINGGGYLILDEVGKHISADKRVAFFKLIKEITNTYKRQIIYISHQVELIDISDKIIRFSSNGNNHVVVE